MLEVQLWLVPRGLLPNERRRDFSLAIDLTCEQESMVGKRDIDIVLKKEANVVSSPLASRAP